MEYQIQEHNSDRMCFRSEQGTTHWALQLLLEALLSGRKCGALDSTQTSER